MVIDGIEVYGSWDDSALINETLQEISNSYDDTDNMKLLELSESTSETIVHVLN